MHKTNGQNLTEFAILIAVIAIVAIAILFALGNDTNKLFENSSNKYKGFEPFKFSSVSQDANNPPPQITPGDFGVKPGDPPVQKCEGNTCTIDFGQFVLTGIPSDFNSFVKSGGADGGTETLADMLKQIADQLELQGKTDQALIIRKLSVTGHNIAATQRAVEKQVNTCNKDSNCLQNLFNQAFATKPDGIDETFDPYYLQGSYNYQVWTSGIGSAREHKLGTSDHAASDQEQYVGQVADKQLGAIFVEYWDELKKTEGVTNETLGIVNQLAFSLGTISEEFNNNYAYISTNNDVSYTASANSMTGIYYNMPAGETFYNYQASTLSHLDSALICSAGNYQDSGTKCNESSR